jgi:molybdopterin molybdotransferase
MLSVDEALAVIASRVPQGPVEAVPLENAAGRVLAREVRSDVDWPPFDTSAMDGYAVRLEDVSPGRVMPERPALVAAGAAPPSPITPGQAVRVMTGAPIPQGTEAIVPVERAVRTPEGVRFEARPEAGAHIRRRGESVRAGTALLAAGSRLRPADVAMAALAGADPIAVHREPRISIAVTGDEVVRGSQAPEPGRLRDSNGPMLLAACREAGWSPRRLPGLSDDPDAVARLFEAAGENEDFLLTTGGVSAGDLDLLPGAALAAGFEILFHGVSVRPGKPIAFGRRGDTIWIGLPGNPVSASVGFVVFAREAIARFEGDSAPRAIRIPARLTEAIRGAGAREAFIDGLWTAGPEGNRVSPVPSVGSHDLAAHARANALIHLPAFGSALAAGAQVECLLRPAALGTA